MLPFPHIDPILITLYGPIALRWYNLSYIVGLVFFLLYSQVLIKKSHLPIPKESIEKLFPWIIVAIIVGGRLGEVLFYPDPSFKHDPLQVFRVWEGGMSFHGAMCALFLTLFWFAKRQRISFLSLADGVAASAPVGIFFGRISNFINDELYGRITSVPWSVAFPSGGYVPRHPSQLYEAFFEGFLLFVVLHISIFRWHALKKPGIIFGLFLLGYSLSRFVIEFFREPDGVFHVFSLTLTTGQMLSLPMLMGGIFLMRYQTK